MKKSLLIFGFALAIISCNKQEGTTAAGLKTAYVDTSKLVQDYNEFKELESQSKTKQEVMAQELQAKAQQFKLDAASFQEEARVKGQQWAQLKGQELQKRERELGMMQETMLKQLQDEFGTKNDTLINKIKKFVKDYGKKNGYDYIYGTGDVVSIMYAKDSYDITDKLLKELNDSYKGTAKKEEPAKEETK
jgi:outer membrane protein